MVSEVTTDDPLSYEAFEKIFRDKYGGFANKPSQISWDSWSQESKLRTMAQLGVVIKPRPDNAESRVSALSDELMRVVSGSDPVPVPPIYGEYAGISVLKNMKPISKHEWGNASAEVKRALYELIVEMPHTRLKEAPTPVEPQHQYGDSW